MNKIKKDYIPQHPLGFLWYASKPHAVWAAATFFAVTIGQVIDTATPYIFGRIVDVATVIIGAGSTDFGPVWLWGLAYIAALAGTNAAFRTSGFLGMQWISRTQATAYNSLFEYLTHHSHTYFSNRFAGALTNKVSHASDGVERFSENFAWHYYPTLIEFIVGGVLIFLTNVWLGAIYVGLIVGLFALNYPLVLYRRPFVVEHATETSNLRGLAVDIATNMNAVHQFARRAFELILLGKQVEKKRVTDVVQWRLSEWILVLNNTLIVIGVGAMLFMMVMLLQSGSITLGEFVMVITLMFGLVGTLTFIGSTMNGFIRVYGDVEEGLTEVLKPHDITDFPKAKGLKISEGAIAFDEVGFSYGTRSVFKDFNLTIPGGQRVGVVGSSGAGKTTFVSLLLRQQDVHEGEVQIDGQNIRKVTLDTLRSNVAVVPQEPLLFHRSIKENIAYGNPKATKKAIEDAAKKAQAHDFIEDLPSGYDTLVGERGVKLSGGQRQRVAIARAILKNAPVLVLDEATSSLDSESEGAIQKALKELMKGKTVIAIAHRLSTIKEMDRIIVLEGGKIIEDGSHEELVGQGGVYARLWSHQAGGFLSEKE